MSDLYKVIEQIESLSHQRITTCPNCSNQQEIQRLDIHADCPNCQTHFKVRSFSANIEIEDIIAESLVWLISDVRFDEIIRKYRKFIEEDNEDN